MSRDYGNPSLGNTYAGGGIGLGPIVAVAELEPYPVPEVTSRDGVDGPAKRAVDDLTRLAAVFGWQARITYARGCFPHAAHGTPGGVKDSLAVRLWRGQERAVAVYVGSEKAWAWDTLAYWRLGSQGWPQRAADLSSFVDMACGVVHRPVKAAGPILGPARRKLSAWGPLKP